MTAKEYMVESRDGTGIAVWKTGSGPPVVLVHGMVADHSTTWRQVLPSLKERFTVHAVDRRGRGGSGDGPDYELRREVEDVASVVDASEEPVYLIGHSFGGLLALEAALLSSNIERLAIYEGVVLRGTDVISPGIVDRYRQILKRGHIQDLLVSFLRDVVKMPETEIELLQSDAHAWEIRLGNAPTIPRELEVQRRYSFDRKRFARMGVPTLLLVGGNSPRRELEWAEVVARDLPNARVAVIEGQEHIAMYTGPEQFVKELILFTQEGTALERVEDLG